MSSSTRPLQATVYALLFVISAACMAALGLSANAYFVPGICLLLAAGLVWSGRGLKWFSAILNLNQLSAIVLILVLWLGDGLGRAKLNISGLALIANLLTGGPLMGVLSLPLLVKLHFGKTLKNWFGRAQRDGERAAAAPAGVINAPHAPNTPHSPHALRALAATFAAAGAALAAPPADAAALSGQVTANGKPAMGAMVTVFNEAKTQRETVYTGADGRYAIQTTFAGKLDVRARLLGFADTRTSVQMTAEQRAEHPLQLLPHATPTERTAALPASAHNARLPWADAGQRAPFISQCNYCHQMGNATTRAPRSHEAWMGTIRKMEGYLAMVTRGEADTMAGVLTRGFDGQPFDAKHDTLANPELARAKVEEWLVGDAMSFIHDMDVAKNGLFYGTDEGHDVLWVLDPATGKTEKIALPEIDLPVGGLFSGLNLHIGIFTGKHGPHSMAEDKQGRLWITNALSSTIMSFDTKTKAFKTYPVPGDALYPHTIRVDEAGIAWFTIVASNQIGRFDPKTEQMTVMRLPSNGLFRWVSDMLFPTILRVASWFPKQDRHLDFSHHRFLGYNVLAFPYGIDVHPKDGSIWYAKLYANKIGRIDAKTMEVTEYDTPLRGPRRPRFDNEGALWIPAFDDGGLMRFDTASRSFESIKLPGLAPGEYETPYALNVDRQNGDVWLTANNTDRVLRYLPASKQFVSYPSPTRVTFLRDMVFTKDGKVCSSQSNLPAWAIEDAVPSYICIDPSGGERDRLALAR